MVRIGLIAVFVTVLAGCPGTRERSFGNAPPPGSGGGCGNGQLDQGETCDSAIAAGMPGACPTACSDGNACTADTLTGTSTSCNAVCASTAIENCQSGDGCCPAGCSNENDDDCSTSCGDGVIDPGETCDNNCVSSCDDANACTNDATIGSVASCSLSCAYTVVTACTSGDGCCPAGCAGSDDDCSTTCGNGAIDAGESCDGDCPVSCDDENACTMDLLTGSAATCNVACSHAVVTECNDGDGCCPAGCAGRDTDCSTTCGNGTVDTGETCDSDCPTDCAGVGDACNIATYVGSPAGCNAACTVTQITACSGGDGCCPQQCTPQTDSDCTAGPSGAVGDPCAVETECQEYGSGFARTCLTSFPDGYCTTFCGPDNACPAGSKCSLELENLCVDECTGPADCRTGYTCAQTFDPLEAPFMACIPGGG